MMPKLQDCSDASRRRFLGRAAVTGVSVPLVAQFGAHAVLGEQAHAKSPQLGSIMDLSGLDKPTDKQGALSILKQNKTRRMHLVNAHTGDDYDLVYFKKGEYLQNSIDRFNHLMRDRRANIATNMDTTLYDQLYLMGQKLGTDGPIHVLSGYRTPETNEKLRRRSTRVAKYSLHMEGRAADIYVPGTPVKELHAIALDIAAGGVGMYSSSHFIHIDTGPVRNWGQ